MQLPGMPIAPEKSRTRIHYAVLAPNGQRMTHRNLAIAVARAYWLTVVSGKPVRIDRMHDGERKGSVHVANDGVEPAHDNTSPTFLDLCRAAHTRCKENR